MVPVPPRRQGKDAMALVAGSKQNAVSMTTSAVSNDQRQHVMGSGQQDRHFVLDMVRGGRPTCSGQSLYTPVDRVRQQVGTATGVSSPFSWSKTAATRHVGNCGSSSPTATNGMGNGTVNGYQTPHGAEGQTVRPVRRAVSIHSRSSPRTRMAPNRHRSHGVAAPTCSTTCSSGCSATVGTAPAGPSLTAAKARSSSAPPPWATTSTVPRNGGTNTQGTGIAPAVTATTPSISPAPGRSHSSAASSTGTPRIRRSNQRGQTRPNEGTQRPARQGPRHARHLHAVRREHATAAGATAIACHTTRRKPNTRLRIPRSRHSPSTVSSQPTARSPSRLPASPCSAATQRPAPRITPPIGRIASPSQSANKRRLASLTDLAIALPYFVPRKPFEADVGAVRAWESPYATAKLNNR